MIPTTTYIKTYINYSRYDATSTHTCGDEWPDYVVCSTVTEAKESVKLVGALYAWMNLEYWLLKLVIGRPLPEHPLDPWHPPEAFPLMCL